MRFITIFSIITALFFLSGCAKDDLQDFPLVETTVTEIEEDGQEENTENEVTDHTATVYGWLTSIQMNNGLLESVEGSNFVSLYDNALAALAFTAQDDFQQAEAIFDFFDNKIDTELLTGDGGFGQFRDASGIPFDNAPKRWLGDNAWLLMAINNYHEATGNHRYTRMATELENWIRSLQDTDGGLWGGFKPDGSRIHKITEGILDAYNAVPGYDAFHENILQFLADQRWDADVRALIADPSDARYRFALDLHAWGFLALEDFPASTLDDAYRFLNSQTASINNQSTKGYCFDEDKDAVWLEGTGQMILAFHEAGRTNKVDEFIVEMEKMLIYSETHSEYAGLPYTTTQSGTAFGLSPLWDTADDQPAVSSSVWYVLGKMGFNPFGIEQVKNVPEGMKFWNSGGLVIGN